MKPIFVILMDTKAILWLTSHPAKTLKNDEMTATYNQFHKMVAEGKRCDYDTIS